MLDSSGFGLPAPVTSENHLAFAARRLRQACVSCELVPGSYVHEAELAQRFGIGRAAVRVALTELTVAGFVSRHARQGWRVAEIDGALATGLIEARALLEPALAKSTLAHAEVAKLRNWRAMMEAVRDRDDASARALAQGLRRQALDLLARGTGRLVAAWLADLWDHLDRLTRALELAGRPIATGDLGPLLDAVLAGDRQAGFDAIAEDQARFKLAVSEAFLATARLAPPPTSVRKRGAGKSAFKPSPSPTVNEETSR